MRVAIVGAGLIGCYLGGQLACSGHSVILLGRERIGNLVARDGLTVSNVKNEVRKADAASYKYVTSVDDLLASAGEIDVVLVTVKSGDTVSSVSSLATLATTIPIVSFQNGVSNADEIQLVLPNHTIIAGMLPFNVIQYQDSAHFHQATLGPCFLADVPAAQAISSALNASSVNTILHPDMPAVLYGKLLVNLNNAINALSGLPLRQQMGMRTYRKCIALCQWEALAVFAAAGITPTSFVPSPVWMLPYVLNLPDFLFNVIASAVLSIDDTAFSSMYEDFVHKRTTEIDFLQGKVTELGKQHGIKTPCCDYVVELVKKAEKEANGSPKLSADELYAQLVSKQ